MEYGSYLNKAVFKKDFGGRKSSSTCLAYKCPHIKWNVCTDMIPPFSHIIHSWHFATFTNVLWQRSFPDCFTFFPNIIFIIPFVAGFINFLAIVQCIPIFLWGVHPLWCLCSFGYSITLSNTIYQLYIGKHLQCLHLFWKIFIALSEKLENNTEAFMASYCYWKTFL